MGDLLGIGDYYSLAAILAIAKGKNAEKHLEPALQSPLDIATAIVKGGNDIVSADNVGGVVAGLHCPVPLIFT